MKKQRSVSICAGGGGSNLSRLSVGFTMAEILLSLTIIGVVAAITLPSLTGNINERTWNTQRKALYARFSQAIALMPALNGYGTLTENESGSITEDNVAETFVTAGLSKVLKINNICDSVHLEDCGIPLSYTNLLGSKADMPTTLYSLNNIFKLSFTEITGTPNSYSQANTKVAAFETANGESILTFYNPYCQPELGKSALNDYSQPKICANFIYDLNGSKGPNTVGKDIGVMSALYPSDSVVVMPVPIYNISGTYEQQEASSVCRNKDDETRLPNLEEFMSLTINRKFLGINNEESIGYWTSTLVSSTKAKMVDMGLGRVYSTSRTRPSAVQCVKRY